MLEHTELKKRSKKKSWKWFGHFFADVCVYTIVVSGVIYLGMSCGHNQDFFGEK